ncbi:uncharacterized protein LOC141656871 [Silene latifolia]|uniref:uncharacterized protein LOC141656871 n=1 Tax=Silene latifolia TaxID=37657 RepID=UPI003D777CC6
MEMGLNQHRNYLVLVVFVTFSVNLMITAAATQSYSGADTGRSIIQMQKTANAIARIDPLDQFRKYRGQYNITNKHYWSSTIFTGIYGYTIGLLWLVAGIVYSIYLLGKACCLENKKRKPRRRTPCQKQCHLFPIVSTTVFTVVAIIASGVALGGNARFYSRAKTIMTVIINTADQASDSMNNATGAMRKMSINLEESGTFDGDKAARFLASTSDKLDYEATGLEEHAQRNRSLSVEVLTIMYILTSATICLNLVASIALSAFGILRFRRVVYMLVVLAWFLTVLSWLLFGAYSFIEKFSADTCTALHNFEQNQENNSLNTILPCDELRSARTALSDVSIGLFEVLNQVNVNISILRANSLPSLNYVCNPFSGPPDFLYQPKDCPADSIHIGDIPQVLKMFTCSDISGTRCNEGFITTSEYNVIETYTTSVQNLLDAYPVMENLVNCRLVKDTFSDILVNHCKPVKMYLKTTCVGMLLLSIVMMVLVSTWISTSLHENQHFADGSVKPNSVP